MKKIIGILIALVFSITLMAQDRTVTKSMREGFTYYQYNGVAADTLTANQDTIDFVLAYKADGYVKKLSVKTRFDVIAGADTTVSTSVFGKEFEDDATYVEIIAASTSSAVTADNTIQVLASDWTETIAQHNVTLPALTFLTDITGLSGFPADSIVSNAATLVEAVQTVTPLDKTYRYYRVRYILSGDDSVGTGIKIDDIEIKMYN